MNAGCPGQPVTVPTITGKSNCFSTLPVPVLEFVPGVSVGVLQVAAVGGCVYPAPENIPLCETGTGSDYTDPNNFSVALKSETQPSEVIANVSNSGACDSAQGGWFFDDNSTPSNITLCPCSCSRVNALQGEVYMIDFPKICVIL